MQRAQGPQGLRQRVHLQELPQPLRLHHLCAGRLHTPELGLDPCTNGCTERLHRTNHQGLQ